MKFEYSLGDSFEDSLQPLLSFVHFRTTIDIKYLVQIKAKTHFLINSLFSKNCFFLVLENFRNDWTALPNKAIQTVFKTNIKLEPTQYSLLKIITNGSPKVKNPQMLQ